MDEEYLDIPFTGEQVIDALGNSADIKTAFDAGSNGQVLKKAQSGYQFGDAGDMNTADYDPDGSVAGAGGIAEYISEHSPENVVFVEYGDTNFQNDIYLPYITGKIVACNRSSYGLCICTFATSRYAYFSGVQDNSHVLFEVRTDSSGVASWTTHTKYIEYTENKVSSWGQTPNDTNYPTEKLVKDSLDGKVDAEDFEQYQQTVEAEQTQQNMEIQFLKEASEGVTTHIDRSTSVNYEKPIPSYQSGTAKLADIKAIGGKTEVKNQLVADNSYIASMTRGGVMITNNGDGSITLNGTYDNSESINIWSANNTAPQFTKGHKYYMRLECDETLTWGYSGGGILGIGNYISSASTQTAKPAGLISANAGYTFNNLKVKTKIVDLTLRFPGNEPTSVTDERILAIERELDEDPSFVGSELISADVKRFDSTGFNQWDEDWELGDFNGYSGQPIPSTSHIRSKNFNKAFPSKQYCIYLPNYFTGVAAGIWQYNIHKQPISDNNIYYKGLRAGINLVTLLDDCAYFKLSITETSYNHNICVNLSNESLNGQYKPYMHDSRTIPQALRNFLADKGYGCSAGSIYNELDLVNKKFIQRVDAVDMGTLTYSYNSGDTDYPHFICQLNRAFYSGASALACAVYEIYPRQVTTSTIYADMVGKDMKIYAQATSRNIRVLNRSYTTASEIKSAMSGVLLYYELGEPVEYDISSYLTDVNPLMNIENGGSLTFVQEDTSLQVPNTEDIYYILGGAS